MELIDLVNSVIIFLYQMILLRYSTFILISLTVTFYSPALLDLFRFFFLRLLLCSIMAFPQLGNSDHVVVSVSIDFPTHSKQNAPFHRITYDYSRADCEVFVII